MLFESLKLSYFLMRIYVVKQVLFFIVTVPLFNDSPAEQIPDMFSWGGEEGYAGLPRVRSLQI